MNKIVGFSAIFGIVILLAFAITLTPAENQAIAETSPFPSREKVISVTGQANTSVEPDLLVITFGVENQEKTAREALVSNSEAMTKIVDAIKSVGITEDEIRTSRINIYPVYDSYREPETNKYTQELIGYRVTNTITVKTGQLNTAADIIDGAVGAGANRVDNVFFTLSPKKELQVKDDLLEQAVLNAQSKANKALGPLNHKIIGVKQVVLSEFGMPYPEPLFRSFEADVAMAEGASFKTSTPVFTSDQEVTTTASVMFLIGSN